MIGRLIGATALLLLWIWIAGSLTHSEMKIWVPTALATASATAVVLLVPVCRKGAGAQKIAGWTLVVPAMVLALISFTMTFQVWRLS